MFYTLSGVEMEKNIKKNPQPCRAFQFSGDHKKRNMIKKKR